MGEDDSVCVCMWVVEVFIRLANGTCPPRNSRHTGGILGTLSVFKFRQVREWEKK